MTNIHRYYVNNQPVFITAVCNERKPTLKDALDKKALLSIMRKVKTEHHFKMLGYVILDDHFHWLIEPEQKTVFSNIIQSVKLRFTYHYKKRYGIKDNTIIWQRRFWDHVIRDEGDFQQHLDYIHYNPVKHEYIGDPARYQWSSFQYYFKKGYYLPGWAVDSQPSNIKDLDFE
jgi:putative transposase